MNSKPEKIQIQYTVSAFSNKQKNIIEQLRKCNVYEPEFIHVLPNLRCFIRENNMCSDTFDLNCIGTLTDEGFKYVITYDFIKHEPKDQFNKELVEKYINSEYDKILKEKGFYE